MIGWYLPEISILVYMYFVIQVARYKYYDTYDTTANIIPYEYHTR